MKFISLLALLPLGIIAQNSNAKPRASFTTEGLTNVLNVVAQSRQGNPAKLKEQVGAFLERNPKILESFLTAAGKPEHASARDKAFKFYGEVSSGGDTSKLPVKAIDFVYNNPDVLRLALAGGNEVRKAYPTIIDDFFYTFDKTIRANPGLLTQSKASSVKFSRKEPKAFKQAGRLGIKLAASNTRLASQLAIKYLQVQMYGCGSRGSGGCQCAMPRSLPAPGLANDDEFDIPSSSQNTTDSQEEFDIAGEMSELVNSL